MKRILCLFIICLFSLNVYINASAAEEYELLTPKTQKCYAFHTINIRLQVPTGTKKQEFSYKYDNNTIFIESVDFNNNILSVNLHLTKHNKKTYFSIVNNNKITFKTTIYSFSEKKLRKNIKPVSSVKANVGCVKILKLIPAKFSKSENPFVSFEYKYNNNYLTQNSEFLNYTIESYYLGKENFYFKKSGKTSIKIYYCNYKSKSHSKKNLVSKIYAGKVDVIIAKTTSTLSKSQITLNAFRKTNTTLDNFYSENKLYGENCLNDDNNLLFYNRKDIAKIIFPIYKNNCYKQTGIIKNYNYKSKYSLKISDNSIIRVVNNRYIQALKIGATNIYIYQKTNGVIKKIGTVKIIIKNKISMADTFDTYDKYIRGNLYDDCEHFFYDKLELYKYKTNTINLNSISKEIITNVFKEKYFSIKYDYKSEYFNINNGIFSQTVDGNIPNDIIKTTIIFKDGSKYSFNFYVYSKPD